MLRKVKKILGVRRASVKTSKTGKSAFPILIKQILSFFLFINPKNKINKNVKQMKQVINKIKYFDYSLDASQHESEYIEASLEENEDRIIRQIFIKRKIPVSTNNPYSDSDFTEYINKIFEQQEKERIVRWIVNSIRESLDLNKVLETIVDEIGRLLKVDRCLMALYDKNFEKFYFHNEYRINENIPDLLNDPSHLILDLPQIWQENLIKNNKPIVVDDFEKENLNKIQKDYLQINNIKSLIIIPVRHKTDILGAIMVHQIHFKREWENAHIEILKDTASQIAIAVRQAILYSEVQEATKLKSEFLAGMSHEFRTPLNAIIGFSEMILSEDYGELTDKQKKFMNNVVLSGKHLLKLVNDILDLSKIESGNLELNYEEFNVNLAAFETVSILKSIADKKNISIETKFEKNIFINADIMRFKQIMYNLLSNAIKFTEDNGSIDINLTVADNDLKIEIKDNGIGILKENTDKVFQEFRQINSSYAEKQDGTGLGLALTKKFVEMHNGSIDFNSEIGKGSTFWFILPGAKISNSTQITSGF